MAEDAESSVHPHMRLSSAKMTAIIKSPVPFVPIPETNVFSFLFTNPDVCVPGDHIVTIDALTGISRTRAEHVRRVRRLATALTALRELGGLEIPPQGGRVGILSEGNMDFPVVVHACLYSGIPFVLLNCHWTHEELERALTLSEPTHIFASAACTPLATRSSASVRATLGKPIQIHALSNNRVSPECFDIDTLIARTINVPEIPVCPVRRDMLAYLIFSSGTSGSPKAVMVSQENIVATLVQGTVWSWAAEAQASNNSPPVSGPHPPPESPPIVTRSLGVLPLYHTFGLFANCLRAYLFPNTVVMLPHWNVGEALKAIRKYRIEFLTMVPSMLHKLVTSPLVRNMSKEERRSTFQSLVRIFSGAAHLSGELKNQVRDAFEPNSFAGKRLQVTQGYGMSEGTLGILPSPISVPTRAPPGHDISTALSLNTGMEAALIENIDGRDSLISNPVDQVGELWIRGPNVTLGYWRNERMTKETFGLTLQGLEGSDWLRTGDRFRYDRDGYFYFVDRIKDIFKVGGVQVAPTEIEEAILTHCKSFMSDICVAAVPLVSSGHSHSSDGVEPEVAPRAWVVLSEQGVKQGLEKSAQEIHRVVQEHLSRPKWLRGGIEFINEIPKNTTGKVLRRELQDKYARAQTIPARL